MPDSNLVILLLDVDGVLVEDNGYQAGIARTVDYFATTMGLLGMAPTPADIEVFEANGLTSEWESCPLCVGGLLLAALRVAPTLVLAPEINAAMAQCRPVTANRTVQHPDFAHLARRVGPLIVSGSRPSQASLRVLQDEAGSLHLADASYQAFEALLHSLLDDTANVYTAPITRVFQHFALGSDGYARTYDLPPLFETRSLLHTLDRPALSPAGREMLLGLIGNGRARAALYTARASLPPAGADPRGYSPEAEIAQSLVGLQDVPLVGYGGVTWLAERHDSLPDAFVKPSPVHALAAIGAALAGPQQTGEALEAAYILAEGGLLQPPLDSLHAQPLDLYVFEDAVNGVRAAASAAELLRAAGVHLNLWTVGIVQSGGPKRAALAPLCAFVAPDVNAALESVAGVLNHAGGAGRAE